MVDIFYFIDGEHALNSQYAETIGVKLEDTLLSLFDTGEQALEILKLLSENAIDIVVIDSVAGLVPGWKLREILIVMLVN